MSVDDIYENVKNFDAVVGGMSKCGTTSIVNYLHQHPDIYLPWNSDKNGTYQFSWNYIRNNKTSFFKKYAKGKTSDEKISVFRSNNIIMDERILEIYKRNKDIKIIVLFRDPIKKAYSWYWHDRLKQGIDYSFQESLDKSIFYHRFIELGEYKKGVKNISNIPDKNKYFIVSEKLWSNFSEEINKLYSFLGVSNFDPELNNENKGGKPKSELINDFMVGKRKIPIVTDNFPSLLSAIRKFSYTFNLEPYPPMDSKIKEKLVSHFKKENQGLDEMIDVDLSKFWKWW